jgi:hypothetical protein
MIEQRRSDVRQPPAPPGRSPRVIRRALVLAGPRVLPRPARRSPEATTRRFAPAPKGFLPVTASVAARVATAGLTAGMAWIHLHLYSTGYRHIHTIGILFLLNGIGGLLLAAALLVVPRLLLGVVATLAAIFTAGTLVGLLLSMHGGLFGFDEFAGAPFLDETLWLESFGTAVSAVVALLFLREGWTRTRGAQRVPPTRS